MPESTGPSLDEIEARCQEIGKVIGDAVPKGCGFALLVFSLGEGGFMSYTANAERDGMIKALRECADKLEAGRGTYRAL